ncbi:MAG: calcium-translocating P-type ATPase, PMCA-type [Dysgonamonadaceae bacterium]|jgi:Ca2+-transporting ATPase|nr:calcium-translocating P-type ATPase, PMCA-type [Dysgonamonadaceae bacterium]
MTSISYYNQSLDEVGKLLKTSISEGLTQQEAKKRLQQYGYNEFQKKKSKSLFVKFLEQFKSFMIIVLLIAAIVSGVAEYLQGEGVTDALIILLIVVVNAIIGVVQESKAEQSLEALEKLSAPQCKVIRDGKVALIESRELVPGDLVILDTGDLIPADLRLTEAINLKIQESALTGESLPVEKFTEALSENEVPLGDRDNQAFSSGDVVYGRGQGIVVATGMQTEVGKIASMIQTAGNPPTPLQQKLDKLGKHLGIAALIICALIFVVGVLYGNSILSMFMIAVSLAAAAIPEGLPAVSTIVLSVGVQRMAQKHAIVRTLPAVETLGSTTVICSDKTGTLTQNKMTVVKIFSNGQSKDVEEVWKSAHLTEEQKQILRIALFANDAKLSEYHGRHTTTGDPTETALIDLGLKFKFNKNLLETEHPRVEEIPFDSERKLMTTVHVLDDTYYSVYTKGGLDELLHCCTKIFENGKVIPLTEAKIELIKKANEHLAENALRVLAMGFKRWEKTRPVQHEQLEKDLVFAGMVGMIDPPRDEVKVAVLKCREAGIKPVMITGDHLITAKAIAKQLGILEKNDLAYTGAHVEKMSDEELKEKAPYISVYARVSPEHKVRIVKAFQANGEIVAMTGDGVNDAPALKLADIGTAMGIVGTDVSKEAADIVLADDNFSTIVTAVEEGRRIYDNILKAIEFLLSSNIGELLVLFIAVIFNWGTPLLPIHILWINLVTDSLPALALSFDPAAPDIMRRKPVDSRIPILNRPFATRLALQGIMIGLLSLIAYQIGLHTTPEGRDPLDVARAMTFSVLAFSQLVHVFNVRSGVYSALPRFFTNKFLLWGTLISAGLIFLVLEIPSLHDLFHISHLTNTQWIWVALLSLAPLPVVELTKWVIRLCSDKKSAK